MPQSIKGQASHGRGKVPDVRKQRSEEAQESVRTEVLRC